MELSTSLRFVCSEHFLLNKRILILMIAIFTLGTIYGYVWYEQQLIDTYEHHWWWLPFVPDSPTASLFFTLSLIFMLYHKRIHQGIMGIVSALAFITSFKYGIWAVVMIVAATFQGSSFAWQDAMLVGSHLAMALLVIVYFRWMNIRFVYIMMAFSWTLINDYVDYQYGVFPWLSSVLYDDLFLIKWVTIFLSICSASIAIVLMRFRLREK